MLKIYKKHQNEKKTVETVEIINRRKLKTESIEFEALSNFFLNNFLIILQIMSWNLKKPGAKLSDVNKTVETDISKTLESHKNCL